MNAANQLQWIDYLIMMIYFGFVLGIGFCLKRFMQTSSQFLSAGRSMPAWVAGLAFLSANLGAQEVIGMAASGAKYGIATSHFYWLGPLIAAVPKMLFPFLVILPGLIALAIPQPVPNQPAATGGSAPRSAQYSGGFMGRVPLPSGGAAAAPTTPSEE